MPKIYYAHPMSWYGTKEEEDDVNSLQLEGEVVNPNSEPFTDRVRNAQRTGFPVMDIFAKTIRDDCDVLCFRRFNDGALGAGVAREILEAVIWNKPVWEIFGSEHDKQYVGVFVNKHVIGTNMQGWHKDIGLSEVLTVEATSEKIRRNEL